MSKLGAVVEAVEKHASFVLEQVKRARSDEEFAQAVTERWNKVKAEIPIAKAPTGLPLPRLALPDIDEPGEIARYLFGEGLPGEFPYLNGAYREMYLEPLREIETGSYGNRKSPNGDSCNGVGARMSRAKAPQRPARAPLQEEPTRLFSGLMLAEDTNQRFHFLSAHQRSKRLSTAFDGPTLYGIDSDADGVFGKIGEGGVAVDTVEDMVRLYDGFELGAPNFSASMTISGPAPIIMAMYIAAAKRRFGAKVVPNLRGTIQADIFKEVQAQNETIFPTEASLRFLCDMIEWTTANMPRWYPVSISGYHIGEAGSTPVQQAAYTLSNGFAYAEMLSARGVPVDQFAPRLSFFLDCGLDVEYIALSRVSRKIWAIGMRDVFGANARGQMFKLHTQTSGRSLIAAEFKNNLTRTAAELMLAYMNATNSCHSNSADEPFTTPSEEWIRLAAHGQAILLEESGIFKHTMNMLSGSPGMKAVERAAQHVHGVLKDSGFFEENGLSMRCKTYPFFARGGERFVGAVRMARVGAVHISQHQFRRGAREIILELGRDERAPARLRVQLEHLPARVRAKDVTHSDRPDFSRNPRQRDVFDVEAAIEKEREPWRELIDRHTPRA